MQSLVGKFLVATPNLDRDPFFSKSVVYIYDQQPNVIIGACLNKTSNLQVDDLYRMRGTLNSGALGNVFIGGPVNENALLMIHTEEWQSSNTMITGKGLCVSSDEFMLEKMLQGDRPAYHRIITGMSTWAVDQLQNEIDKWRSWLIVDADYDVFFNYEGEQQWRKAIDLASHQMINSYF